MKVTQLETPALVIDLDALERNMNTMNDLLEGTCLKLRPHYKSHKCTYLAHLQMAAGAKGITCAKLGEAEDLINAGIENVLIANQITTPEKLERLAHLAGKCHLGVCVDSEENIRALERAAKNAGTTIHCLVEYEVGMQRCGVNSAEHFVHLARLIDGAEHLVFEGVQAYAGHLSHEENEEIRSKEAALVEERLRALLKVLEKNKLAVKEVSGCSTGTVAYKKNGSVYTEIQAGSYLFMDAAYRRLHLKFENALTLYTTVISTAGGKVVLDAGMKSIGVDQGAPVCDAYPEAVLNMSEEHSAFETEGPLPRVGDMLGLLPGHCCTTINLHDKIYLARGEKIVDCIPVTSRGKSR